MKRTTFRRACSVISLCCSACVIPAEADVDALRRCGEGGDLLCWDMLVVAPDESSLTFATRTNRPPDHEPSWKVVECDAEDVYPTCDSEVQYEEGRALPITDGARVWPLLAAVASGSSVLRAEFPGTATSTSCEWPDDSGECPSCLLCEAGDFCRVGETRAFVARDGVLEALEAPTPFPGGLSCR